MNGAGPREQRGTPAWHIMRISTAGGKHPAAGWVAGCDRRGRRVADPFLRGVRVLELGESRAVGFAGKLLVDLGADVWLAEAVGRGNRLRRRRPLLPSG